MSTTLENKSRVQASVYSFGIFAFLLILIFFWKIITPIPPFEIPPIIELEIGLGVEGLGNRDAGGSGQNDNDIATSNEASVIPNVSSNAENIIVDDSEPTAVVKTNPKIKNNQTNKADAPVVEEKPNTELINALAALKNKNKHDGKGEGDGNTGGSGTGSQQGVGSGDGTGHGDNTPGYNGKGGYDLKGRMLVKKPERMTDSEEEGIVIVEIIVNEDGKVIKATPGQRGSTTTDAKLYAKARQAALSAKFNPSPTGVTEQRGTYTFVFTLE
ncbi:MAG: energy transducer TonB [Bacteroidia bacterium]|nr:energy transducer TonB [Bacteroidia bacterium]